MQNRAARAKNPEAVDRIINAPLKLSAGKNGCEKTLACQRAKDSKYAPDFHIYNVTLSRPALIYSQARAGYAIKYLSVSAAFEFSGSFMGAA